ncbi:MAG: ATP-dependent zinc metalloprotease FtsH [Planctomycetota bacterium]|jgi:cell division protease FtsH
MNDNDKKGVPNKDKDRKRPVKSGFNIVFTLLFVIFVAMVMVTVFDESPLGNANEISINTFRKLLYSFRIARLDVNEYEKVEGEYILDVTRTRSDLDRSEYELGKNPNLRPFIMELSQEGLLKQAPDYFDYVGKQVDNGDPGRLLADIEDGRILVNSCYTVTGDTQVPGIRKRSPDLDPAAAYPDSEIKTELYVNFVNEFNLARSSRYIFSPDASSGSDRANLKGILAAIQEKFPNVTPTSFSFENEGSLTYSRPNTFWTTIFAPLIPWVLIVGLLWFFIIRQMRMGGGGGNVLSFGKSRATLVNKEKTNITFVDVAGIEEAKEEVTEIIEFLKNPGKFSRLGGRIPSGVLLVGAPGTGKTLLAKAIAGEADVPFYSICGSDFVEMFVGVGASRVRDLFRQARENSPCLIFLDEIDAVGRKRGSGLGGGHDEREQTLNAILVEMDGFEKDEGIILLAATNRPDVLDPALLRPGRFDREITIDLPDLRAREAILKVHCRKVKVAGGVTLSVIARGTPGFSGAELAAIVNEAALLATMKDRSAVEMADFEEARDKVRWGRQKKSRVMDEEDRRVTAYHESGHALVAHLMPEAEQLHKVTIIPRGAALGATMILPEKDRYHFRKRELLANIQVLYAGRIAEEIFCGDISGGAQNDIERASETARIMVCQLGMSDKIGPISYGEQQDHVFLGEELVRSKHHSDEVFRQIDAEVKRILDDCYEETKQIVEEHRQIIVNMAEALLQYETLTGAEVAQIIAGKPVEEIEFEYAIKPTEDEPEESPVEEAQPKKKKEEPDLDPGDLPTAGEPAY